MPDSTPPKRSAGLAVPPRGRAASAPVRAGVRPAVSVERADVLEEQRTGSVDLIVSEILRGLHEGRYVPGQKLIETDLTRRCGVSRSSVREALRRLEAEGLVMASLHRGASIRIFTRNEVRDIAEVSEHMGGLAACLAAKRLTKAKDADALRRVLVEMREQFARGNSFDLSHSRHRFFEEVAALTGNQELRHFLLRLGADVLRVQFRIVYDLAFAKQDLEDFQGVVDAILARDAARAEATIRLYFRRSAAAIQQLPDTHFAA